MRFPALAVLIAPLALGACVSASATFLGPRQNLAPVPEDQVRLFLPEDSVPADCERLAIIHTSGDAKMTSDSQMLRAAKRRAGSVGANAIQLRSARDPGTGARIASVFIPGVTADRKGEMLAFVCAEPQTSTFLGAVREFLGLAD